MYWLVWLKIAQKHSTWTLNLNYPTNSSIINELFNLRAILCGFFLTIKFFQNISTRDCWRFATESRRSRIKIGNVWIKFIWSPLKQLILLQVSCRNIVKENGKENAEKNGFSSLNNIDRSKKIPRGASSPAVKNMCDTNSWPVEFDSLDIW